MAQLQDTDSFNPLMDDEDFFAFLGEMDNDWLLDALPLKLPDDSSKSPKRNRRISVKKPRKSRRLDLLKTHDHVADLESQLQILRERYEYQESLDQSNWKLLAMHERVLKKKVEIENARLRKLLDTQAKLIQQICAQMQQHVGMLSKGMQGDSRITSLTDAAHIYQVMQMCLDMRCKSRLDAIVGLCSDDSACKLQRIQWQTLPLGDRDVGVDFRESLAMPFKSAFVLRTIRPSAVLDVAACPMTTDSFLTHLSPGPYLESPSERQLFLQRLVIVLGKTMLLWEDALCWQSDAKSAPVIVRCSGWALVTSVVDHPDNLSVVHAGGFIQIHATDGSSLHPSDPLVNEIVRAMQSLQKARCTNLENVLMDAFCRRPASSL